MNRTALFLVWILAIDFTAAEGVDNRNTFSSQDGGGFTSNRQFYIVKPYDCLWTIAGTHLGDSFRWREIWRLNRSIENPHLIYPDDRLILPGAGRYTGADTIPRPDFSFLTRGLDIRPHSSLSRKENGDSAVSDTHATAKKTTMTDEELRASFSTDRFFSHSVFQRAAFLWMDKDARGDVFPGEGILSSCQKSDVFTRFSDVEITVYGAEPFQAGDTVDIYSSQKFIRFHDQLANIVRRTGRGVVRETSGQESRVRLIDVWDVIRCGDRIGQATASLSPPVIDSVIDPDISLGATILHQVEKTGSFYLYHTFLIDKGRVDGVKLGDVFAAFPTTPSEETMPEKQPLEQPASFAAVIHVGMSSATCAILKIFNTDTHVGGYVRLVKRIIFSTPVADQAGVTSSGSK